MKRWRRKIDESLMTGSSCLQSSKWVAKSATCNARLEAVVCLLDLMMSDGGRTQRHASPPHEIEITLLWQRGQHPNGS